MIETTAPKEVIGAVRASNDVVVRTAIQSIVTRAAEEIIVAAFAIENIPVSVARGEQLASVGNRDSAQP